MRDAALLRLTPVHHWADTLRPGGHGCKQGLLFIEAARAKLLVVEVKHLRTHCLLSDMRLPRD